MVPEAPEAGQWPVGMNHGFSSMVHLVILQPVGLFQFINQSLWEDLEIILKYNKMWELLRKNILRIINLGKKSGTHFVQNNGLKSVHVQMPRSRE